MAKRNGQCYLFANWKMYLDYDDSNILANAIAAAKKKIPATVKMAVFPSALSLYPVGQVLGDVGISVGPQNVYWVDKGGYTGEVSAVMYKAAGCEYALVGHSERRLQMRENNHDVRQKTEAILAAGLTPVLCVGETKEEREDGKADTSIEIQLRSAFHEIVWPKDRELIVAYEPVWAVGTGLTCEPQEADRIHAGIKKMISLLVPNAEPVILYGGSVKADNVKSYLTGDNTSGVLVGGASTKLESWMEIVNSLE